MRAILSVSDKTGLVDFAKGLNELGIEIFSTGGTKKALQDAGVPVHSVSDITNYPEILDGRVKTLHPMVHGGILARRDLENHMSQLKEKGITPIDMVVVNLYPFVQTVSKEKVDLTEALENIDIGGPAMIRAAAKNFPRVTAICSPDDYDPLLKELQSNSGETTLDFRRTMAQKAFSTISGYDQAISAYLVGKEQSFGDTITLKLDKAFRLRYGENPHQQAALYTNSAYQFSSLTKARVLSGKELSFNNLWDLEAALQIAQDFLPPFAAVIKHTNPCGAAIGKTLAEAYSKALACDPLSAFGSVIALNRIVDIEAARLIHETDFIECVLAPNFQSEALELMKKKKPRRLIAIGKLEPPAEDDPEIRMISGGALVQTRDNVDIRAADLKIVTQAKPSPNQIEDLLFGFKAVKHVKSNAVLICKGGATVGIGPGQTSRVDSSLIAVRKAGDRARGAVAASDAFFPMTDGLEVLAEAGVAAVIQPGGSKADPEVIAAADRLGVVMVFTGIRHFKH